MTRGHRGLEGVTGGFRGFNGLLGVNRVTRGYRGLEGVKGAYKGLDGVTRGYNGFTLLGKKVTPSPSARDLGLQVDSTLSYDEHVTQTVSSCIGSLCMINRVNICLMLGH